MAKAPRADWARGAGERVVEEHGIECLPIDPFAIARDEDIEVEAKPRTAKGVSGMLQKVGDSVGIIYATDVPSEGFQRFSVGHELGHYFLDGHIEYLFRDGVLHASRAGFGTGDPYEIEADHFSAGLLMPHDLFVPAMNRAGDGFAGIKELADLCKTSLTATAIQYTKFSDLLVAVVVSSGPVICYAFMSESFKQIPKMGDWLRPGDPVPTGTPTSYFNRDTQQVGRGARREERSSLVDWFNGETDFELYEDVVGLGSYERTLTVLFPTEDVDLDDDEVDDSWNPQFSRSRRR